MVANSAGAGTPLGLLGQAYSNPWGEGGQWGNQPQIGNQQLTLGPDAAGASPDSVNPNDWTITGSATNPTRAMAGAPLSSLGSATPNLQDASQNPGNAGPSIGGAAPMTTTNPAIPTNTASPASPAGPGAAPGFAPRFWGGQQQSTFPRRSFGSMPAAGWNSGSWNPRSAGAFWNRLGNVGGA